MVEKTLRWVKWRMWSLERNFQEPLASLMLLQKVNRALSGPIGRVQALCIGKGMAAAMIGITEPRGIEVFPRHLLFKPEGVITFVFIFQWCGSSLWIEGMKALF